MNWYKKIATRGRYKGQLQGDENRPGDLAFRDVIEDNELIEGKYVRVLSRMIKENDWDGVKQYTEELKSQGHSGGRINSMLTRAMHGVRL